MAEMVHFYQKAVINNYKTNQAGVPVFEDKDFIRIRTGDKNFIYDQPVNDQMKARYAKEYANYKQGKLTPLIGTPLDEWAQISASQVETLKYHGLRTVEELSTLTDAALQSLGMGYFEIRKKALKFVESKKDVEMQSKQEAYIASLEAKIAALSAIAEKKQSEKEFIPEDTVARNMETIESLENQLTDSKGTVFDEKKHAVDEDGIPLLNENGTFKRK